MKYLLSIIFVFIVLQVIFSCKTDKITIFESKNSDYTTAREYFDSIMYQDFKEMAYKTGNIKFFMPTPNENSFKIVYRKMRAGLYDIMPINLSSDTLFILDAQSVEGFSISIFWNKRDTCVKYEKVMQKNGNSLSRLNIERMQLISAWDTTNIRNRDSISYAFRKNGFWCHTPEYLYTASRIIFECNKTKCDYYMFHDWIDLKK